MALSNHTPNDDFSRIKEIVVGALDLHGAERVAFLNESCKDDAILRSEVESLLEQQGTSGAEGVAEDLLRGVQGAAAQVFTQQLPDVLAGRYRVDAFLAEGGMGRVYRVHDLELDVPVALKTIHPRVAADPLYLRLFKQEVLLARSVSHPSVCRIFDLSRDEPTGVAFLTMEYLQGDTLAAAIRTDGRMKPERIVPLAHQMAGALDAAHQAGIVHRDLKTANVMLVTSSDGERAVITDFGLAVAVDEGSRSRSPSGRIAGTPAYMSPEQARGETIGPASDLYSFGVVLFEMCTGQLPFRGSALAPIDSPLEAAILRLLAQDPSERFASAREAVLALEGGKPHALAARRSLPAERDAFVGREHELQLIADHLEGDAPNTSLLSLLGIGGAGKTRLARKYGWDSLARWPGGVWFCDLSDCRSIFGMASAVASGIEVSLGPQDPVDQLGDAIARCGRALIVLDNFEQVAEFAEETIGRWLIAAPQARFLVTSQRRLQLPDEHALDLGPLDQEAEGIELFAKRVRLHRPGFVVDESNRAQVVQVLERLDGLPLAIELAAARLRILSLADLNTRMAQRFRVLAGGAKGKHATLRKTMDWSWDLLDLVEQSTLAQVAVFEGGFLLKAAEEIVDLSHVEDDPFVIDVLQSLVDKSWLRISAVDGAPRFSMFTTVQAYAREKLQEVEAREDGLSQRHALYFARMGTPEALAHLQHRDGASRRASLRTELDNVIAACRRAIKEQNEDIAVPAFFAAEAVLMSRGPFALAMELASEVLGVTSDTAPRAKVLMSLGRFTYLCGDVEQAVTLFEETCLLHRELGDLRSESQTLGAIGTMRRVQGRMDEACAMYEQALVGLRACGDRSGEALILGNLGHYHHEQGRYDEAYGLYETARAVYRDNGNRMEEGRMLTNLALVSSRLGKATASEDFSRAALAAYREIGNLSGEGTVQQNHALHLHQQGRYEEAQPLYESALRITRETGNRSNEAVALDCLGNMNQQQRQYDQARRYYDAALVLHRALSKRRYEGITLGNLASLDIAEGDLDAAEERITRALSIHREVRERTFEGIALGILGRLRRLQGRLAEARDAAQEALTRAREIEEPASIADSLCELTQLELAEDNLAAARSAWQAAERIAGTLSLTPESGLSRLIEELREALALEP